MAIEKLKPMIRPSSVSVAAWMTAKSSRVPVSIARRFEIATPARDAMASAISASTNTSIG
jgi:hypothetical protein